MQEKFPQKSDYPDSFSILDDPYKDINLYIQLFVASASAYFETDPITKYLFKKRFYLVDDYLRNESSARFSKALDVGCGIGFLLPLLASYADEVVALDYSAPVMEYARFMAKKRNLNTTSFVQGDIIDLPFEDDSFDLVVCMSVLEHFKDPKIPLSELKRVLKAGGILIAGYPSETLLFHFLHTKASRIMPKRKKIQKIFDKEKPGEEFSAPHVSDGKIIQQAIYDVGLHERDKKSIKLFPLFFELYAINFLQK